MAKKLKLWAGCDDGRYEYALWATDIEDVARRTAWRYGYVADKQYGMIEQKGNKQLAEIISCKNYIYRRLLNGDSEWEKWREIPISKII